MEDWRFKVITHICSNVYQTSFKILCSSHIWHRRRHVRPTTRKCDRRKGSCLVEKSAEKSRLLSIIIYIPWLTFHFWRLSKLSHTNIGLQQCPISFGSGTYSLYYRCVFHTTAHGRNVNPGLNRHFWRFFLTVNEHTGGRIHLKMICRQRLEANQAPIHQNRNLQFSNEI